MRYSTIKNCNEASNIMIPTINERMLDSIKTSTMYKDAPPIYQSQNSIKLLSSDTITTNGWDTVYAIKAKYLNKSIILKHSSPKTFEKNMIEDDETYALKSGQFNDWQIVSGGDGKNVNLEIPVKSGNYVTPSGKIYDISNAKFIAQVKLAYIYNQQQNRELSDGEYKLKVDSSQTNPVSIVDAYMPSSIPNTHQFIIRGIMNQWLNENLKAFDAVFCSVYLSTLSTTDEFKWTKPTYMGYAYAEKESFEDSVFAVLCMTNNHSPAGLSNQVSSIILDSNDISALVINTSLFIKEIYVPGLKATYASQNIDFQINDRIVTAKGFQLDKVKYGLIWYTPVVENFRVEFNNSTIQMTMNIKIHISPGIDAYVDVTTYQSLGKLLNVKNQPIIAYKNTAPAKTTHRIELDAGVIATAAIVEIVLALASAVAFAAVEKIMYRVLICIIAGICAALIASIIVIVREVVAKGVVNALPSAMDFVQNISNPIVWPLCDPTDPNRYELDDVIYNNEIILKGKPGFTI